VRAIREVEFSEMRANLFLKKKDSQVKIRIK
jgi:hypothetical protein